MVFNWVELVEEEEGGLICIRGIRLIVEGAGEGVS